MNSTESLVPLDEVARRLACTVRTIWRMIQKRELPPPIRIGKRAALPSSEVDAYIERLKASRFQASRGGL